MSGRAELARSNITVMDDVVEVIISRQAEMGVRIA